ncbi:uncharacterized protein LOC115455536 [Manduca sexta]|uniref:Uncharacterized protein n=1 Tax=Manduca sexta TaxID=7130 RepID=A0A921YPP1_MANSE|nr:uncharacterized protein LOC115455536 [Manduca sexta]KAG6442839.1 hypothetical protein O3G_MSEX002520 [Manduca sexta]
MFISLISYWARKKTYAICLLVVVGLIIISLYLNNLQQQYDKTLTSERCISELKSVKYQLNVVTEYKNRIDKLLTDTQKYQEADKERFKDVMESCFAMRQQSVLCQNQFEDLQAESKKLRADYERVSKELELLKSQSNPR